MQQNNFSPDRSPPNRATKVDPLDARTRRSRTDQSRRARRATSFFTASLITLVLVACSTPSENPPPPPPPATGNLFLVVGDSDLNGLHVVNTTTGVATVVGSGNSGIASDSPGLAPTNNSAQLFGSDDTNLRLVKRDGSGWDTLGAPAPLSEGLAFDLEKGVLYAASNGYLHVRSPSTGETIETWLGPPNQPDIEGLTFDPESRTLYGLARGAAIQPEFYRGLYALDVEAQIPEWTVVGSTGGLWAAAGLAFDLDAAVLYAVGRQDDPGGLFRIDPKTGDTTKVGDTGLTSAAGGLAWVE